MTLGVVSKAAAAAAALVLIAAASPSRADMCDDILEALKKQAEPLMSSDAKGAALCAGMGQLVGFMKSAQTVANQCLEGAKKETAVGGMTEMIKAMEEGIGGQCK